MNLDVVKQTLRGPMIPVMTNLNGDLSIDHAAITDQRMIRAEVFEHFRDRGGQQEVIRQQIGDVLKGDSRQARR